VNEALRLDSKNIWGLFFRGQIFLKQDKRKLALEDFTSANKFAPTNKSISRTLETLRSKMSTAECIPVIGAVQ